MKIKPFYIAVELRTGETIEPVRVLAVDKIAAERTCRAQKWPYEDTPRVHLLMGFHALRREGRIAADSFDAFLEQVADYVGGNSLDDGQEEDQDEDDPIEAGTTS